jgi:signal transduction histidine kinase
MVSQALRASMVVIGVAAVGWSIGPFSSPPTVALCGVVMVGVLVAWRAHRLGYTQTATLIASLVWWAASTVGVTRFWGIDGHTSVMLVPSILVGGLLMGPRGAAGIAGLCIAWVAHQYAFGPLEFTVERPPRREERAQDLMLSFGVIGVFVWQVVRHYQQFLAEQQRAEGLQRALLEQAPAAMLVVDAEQRVELASQAARELLGADPVGLSLHEVLHTDGPEAKVTPRFGGVPVAVDRRRLVEGADERQILVLTDLRAQRAEQQRQARALQAAEAASRAKSTFLANMSHELRTPLNAIIGYSEMLEEELDDDQQLADVGRVLSSGRHLLGLIDDVLDMSRVESGKVRIERDDVDLPRLLDEIRSSLAPLADGRGVKLTVLSTTPTLHTDRQRLRQVLANLVSNAAKFARSTVMVVVERHGDDLRFDVVDDGPGIDPEVLPQLFQPFARSADSEGGTGLGLALSREFAHRLGGRLRLLPSAQGAHFRLTLPFSPPRATGHSPARRFYGERASLDA